MADDNDVEIRISANATDVQAGMADASKSVDTGTDAIQSAMRDMASSVQQTMEAFRQSFTQLAEQHSAAAKKMRDDMEKTSHGLMGSFQAIVDGAKEHFGKLGEVLEGVSKHFAALAAVAAGGAALKESVSAAVDWDMQANKLSKSLGISSERASDYMVAMHKLGIESDTLTSAAMRVSMQIMKGSEAFEQLGVATKDTAGNYRPVMDVITETNEKIKEIKNPIEQNQAGLQAYGRSWQELKPLMKLTTEQLDEAAQKAREMGLEVTPQAIATAVTYKQNMRELHEAMEAFSVNIGNQVLPMFNNLAKEFAEGAQKLITTLAPAFRLVGVIAEQFGELIVNAAEFVASAAKDIGSWLDDIAKNFAAVFTDGIPSDIDYVQGIIASFKVFFIGIRVFFEEAIEAIKRVFDGLGKSIATVLATVTSTLSGGLSAGKAAWEAGMQDIEDTERKHVQKMLDIAAKGGADINKALFGGPEKEKEKKSASTDDGRHFDGGKNKGAKSHLMQDLQQELAAMKAKQEAEGEYVQFSKQQEEEFWQSRLSRAAKGSDDEKAILLKIAETKAQVNKESSDAQIKLMESELGKMKGHYDEQIALIQKIGAAKEREYQNDAIKRQEIEQETALKIAAKQREAVEAQRKLQTEITNGVMKGKEDQIALEREKLDLSYSLGQISMQEKLAAEVEFLDQSWAIQKAALDQEVAGYEMGTEEWQKALNKRLAAEDKYQLDRQKAVGKQQIEADKPSDNIGKSVESSVGGALTSMLMKEKTSAKALQDLYKQVAQTFLEQMVTKPINEMAGRAAKEVAEYLEPMAAKWASFFTTNTAAHTASAATSVATTTGQAATETGAAAAPAAALSFKALAGIPIVGPALGMAAMVATLAAIRNLTSHSAAGGFDIPAGLNPVTQLHEKEMVLPAHIAEPMRDMLASGGGHAGPTVQIKAARMPGGFFAMHEDELVKVIKSAQGKFKL